MERPPFKMTPVALSTWMYGETLRAPGQLAMMLRHTDKANAAPVKPAKQPKRRK